MIEIKEEWKDIKNYEGLYQVSNLGRVKSLERKKKSPLKNQKYAILKEKILKQSKDAEGYPIVGLTKNGKRKTNLVHRLVAETFLPIINHIDGNKENNNIANLEFCNQSHNIKEAFRLGLQKATKGKESTSSKKVRQYDLKGNFIREWDCTMDIQRELKYANQNISACCRKESKSAYGYVWRYVNE